MTGPDTRRQSIARTGLTSQTNNMKERQNWHGKQREVSAFGQAAFMKSEMDIPRKQALLSEGLLKTNGTKADFLRTMTHELRTPLNVIIGLCQFLERDRKTSLSPMQKDAVDRMERNARSLLQSVNHLLEAVRKGDFTD